MRTTVIPHLLAVVLLAACTAREEPLEVRTRPSETTPVTTPTTLEAPATIETATFGLG